MSDSLLVQCGDIAVALGSAEHLVDAVDVVDSDVVDSDDGAGAGMPALRVRQRRAGRALLGRLVAEVLGRDAALSPLGTRAGGQPFLMRCEAAGISLSHSQDWVAAALRPSGPVGIDVQVPVPITSAVRRRWCTPTASAALETMAPSARDVEFAWIWSANEATAKASGIGLQWSRPVPIEPDVGSGRWGSFAWTMLRELSPVPLSVARSVSRARP